MNVVPMVPWKIKVHVLRKPSRSSEGVLPLTNRITTRKFLLTTLDVIYGFSLSFRSLQIPPSKSVASDICISGLTLAQTLAGIAIQGVIWLSDEDIYLIFHPQFLFHIVSKCSVTSQNFVQNIPRHPNHKVVCSPHCSKRRSRHQLCNERHGPLKGIGERRRFSWISSPPSSMRIWHRGVLKKRPQIFGSYDPIPLVCKLIQPLSLYCYVCWLGNRQPHLQRERT